MHAHADLQLPVLGALARGLPGHGGAGVVLGKAGAVARPRRRRLPRGRDRAPARGDRLRRRTRPCGDDRGGPRPDPCDRWWIGQCVEDRRDVGGRSGRGGGRRGGLGVRPTRGAGGMARYKGGLPDEPPARPAHLAPAVARAADPAAAGAHRPSGGQRPGPGPVDRRAGAPRRAGGRGVDRAPRAGARLDAGGRRRPADRGEPVGRHLAGPLPLRARSRPAGPVRGVRGAPAVPATSSRRSSALDPHLDDGARPRLQRRAVAAAAGRWPGVGQSLSADRVRARRRRQHGGGGRLHEDGRARMATGGGTCRHRRRARSRRALPDPRPPRAGGDQGRPARLSERDEGGVATNRDRPLLASERPCRHLPPGADLHSPRPR